MSVTADLLLEVMRVINQLAQTADESFTLALRATLGRLRIVPDWRPNLVLQRGVLFHYPYGETRGAFNQAPVTRRSWGYLQ